MVKLEDNLILYLDVTDEILGPREGEYLPKATPQDKDSEETPASLSLLPLDLSAWIDPSQAWLWGYMEFQLLWLPTHHLTLCSPAVTASLCHKVNICQGAGQDSTSGAGSLPVLKHSIPELGCPCIHLVNGEQADLSFTVIGLVFWVCPLPSCQKGLYRTALLHRPQIRCRLRPELEEISKSIH